MNKESVKVDGTIVYWDETNDTGVVEYMNKGSDKKSKAILLFGNVIGTMFNDAPNIEATKQEKEGIKNIGASVRCHIIKAVHKENAGDDDKTDIAVDVYLITKEPPRKAE